MSKIDSFKSDLQESVTFAHNIALEAKNNSEAAITEIQQVKAELNDTRNEMAALKAENDFLKCPRISKSLKVCHEAYFDLVFDLRKNFWSQKKVLFLIFRPDLISV